jgi:hypothetical protein
VANGTAAIYVSFEGLATNDPDMFQQVGPENTYILARLIQALQEAGAAVETKDAVNGIGFGVGGVSGLAASGEMAVANINALARQMYADAAQKFGRKAAASVKKHHLAQMAKFIQSHPNYPKLMRHFKNMPELLLPLPRTKLVPPAAANVNSQAFARHFSKQYFQAFRRWPSSQYMQTIARQLNGRVNMFKALGRHATWYVPAVLGAYNVYDAAPEVRMRTLFEEGFGIMGGAIGTWTGGYIASAICLGPFGSFVLVFIIASLSGLYLAHKFKQIGGGAYDLGSTLGNDLTFYSPDQLLERF